MRKWKEVKKIKKVICLIVVFLLALSLSASAFQNEPKVFGGLNFGGLVGLYSPNFGELKDYLDIANDFWEADLSFGEKTMYGLTVEYEITPNFKVRGEWNGFNTQISVKDGHGWTGYKAQYELSINSYTVSGIHMVTSEKPVSWYIGVGLGQFRTNFQWDEVISIRGSPVWSSIGEEAERPIGFQVLAGIRVGTGAIFLQGEARYLFAQVRMEDFQSVREYDGQRIEAIIIDLSGLVLTIGAVVRL